MDYEERIAKIEAFVDAFRKDVDRLCNAIAELRQHNEKSIGELRQHTDNALAELRASLDAQRKEACANMRWMIGLTLVDTSMILGLYGKIFSLY
jgi:hypothetical protein